ncbi:hypothetical protein GCM10010415_51230 [Streptomyces atrovirens]
MRVVIVRSVPDCAVVMGSLPGEANPRRMPRAGVLTPARFLTPGSAVGPAGLWACGAWCSGGCVVAVRARAAEPHVDTAPRPWGVVVAVGRKHQGPQGEPAAGPPPEGRGELREQPRHTRGSPARYAPRTRDTV